MRQNKATRRLAAGVLVLAVAMVVRYTGPPVPAWSQTAKSKPGPAQKQAPAPQVRYGTKGLPRPVLELREALLAAVESGDIEELRHVYDLNDLKPDLGAAPKTDPVAHWKRISGDGQGREVLAALSLMLDAGYVVLPLGPDLENNLLYVWPYFAEWPLRQLTPRQEVELLRLVPPSAVREMKDKGKYTHWRLVIGADGTWHALRKGD
jgi:hypothetical protein